MCMGIPMKVVEMRENHALCEANGKQELIDMILVGEQDTGTWILNFLGSAREVLSTKNAEQIRHALAAVNNVMQGNSQIDHLFADLVNRDPQLPEHLQAQVDTKQE